MLVGLTVELDPAVDPSAVVFASRATGEDWFAYEQPARGGAAVAALGALRRLEADGPGRFAAVAAAWRELAGGAIAGDDPGPPGSGPGRGRRLRVRARRRQRPALGRASAPARSSSPRSRSRAATARSA